MSLDNDPSGKTESSDSPGARAAVHVRSPPRRIWRLARKELRESLRDRRTLATLIAMPLIVYPLLGSVIQRFAINRLDPNAPAAIVVFDGNIPDEIARAIVKGPERDVNPADDSGKDLILSHDQTPSLQDVARTLAGPSTGTEIGSLARSEDADGPPVRLQRYGQPAKSEFIEEILQAKEADVAVRVKLAVRDAVTGGLTPGDFEVISLSGDTFSRRAAIVVEQRLQAFREREVRQLLDQTRFRSSIMPTISRHTVASRTPAPSPLGAFVPLMLVLMTMTGAVYPAIDLTAGERERGTLEMLMAAPVSRAQLLTGKFIAVVTVAVLTALINLIAMLLTLYATGFDRVLLADGASFRMFFSVLALLVVFASFFSAVLLSITSFARSFREAQAWLIPLMLVSLAPGILSLMPGVNLTAGLAILPLVNIVLLGRELFQGTAAIHLYVITLLSTLVYTILALRVAAGVFGHDTVLFGNSAGAALMLKRPQEKRIRVPISVGIGWLVVLVPLFLVLSGLRSRIVAPENLTGQLILSGILTIVLFAALPVVISTWLRVSAVNAFALRWFHLTALIGAVLLGGTLWTIAYQVLVFSKGPLQWMELLNNTKLRELAERLTSETPFLIRIVTLALIPAVCEELFFRGFLINTLQKNSGMWLKPMLISTFVFAAFHVVVDQSLTLERFPATFLLGLVLCGIRLSSGSIFPGMTMHAISNGLLLSLKELDPVFQAIGLNLNVENESSLPAWFLVTSALISCFGAALVWLGRRK
ncbi:MAG: ABC transporter permease subunit/CPBP intramembrane protease [Planctomycetaceae bacterium]